MMRRCRGIPWMPRGCGPRPPHCYWVGGSIGLGEGRGLCTSHSNGVNKALEPASPEAAAGGGGEMTRAEAYRKINNLDFMTAAKILFTAPPKEKKFGLDFHLVQLFFACMPSLAVYLVAQYARYEIRRMEAELELKKQAEEEEKAKQAEEEARAKEKEMDALKDEPDPELVKVKVRLDALEEAVKEIANETKIVSRKNIVKDRKCEKKEPVPTSERDSNSEAKSGTDELAIKEIRNGSSPTANTSPENITKTGK